MCDSMYADPQEKGDHIMDGLILTVLTIEYDG